MTKRTRPRKDDGASRPGQWERKHGARALSRHLAAGSLDGRTWVARALAAIGDALADDRGGWTNVTAAERLLIERCAAETLFLRAIEAWALRQLELIVNDGDGPRLLAPLAKGYTSHLSALTRALQALGIRPDKVERLPDLREYLDERDGNDGRSASGPAGRARAEEDRIEGSRAPADAVGEPPLSHEGVL